MHTDTNRPSLTVILAAVDDYETIVETLRAAEEQTAAADLELLMVVDSLARFDAPADFAQRHPHVRVVEVGRPLLLQQARAIGVTHAKGDFVFILEDHCLPERDCLARILARMRDGRWSVIGPGFTSGNRRSVWGRAANLLTYGEWMGFEHGEERAYVSGYSSAWRRSSLESFPATLEQDLAIPSRLQQRLREAGERLYFEPRAVMVHWEASSHRWVSSILFQQGRGMGFVRQGTAPWGGKVRASLRWPALVAYRGLRGMRAWWRMRETSPGVLFAVPWLACVWSTGEMLGYWSRDGESLLRNVSEVERKRQPFIDEREPIRRPWTSSRDT
jgi:GT2 family glycosyltransferase